MIVLTQKQKMIQKNIIIKILYNVLYSSVLYFFICVGFIYLHKKNFEFKKRKLIDNFYIFQFNFNFILYINFWFIRKSKIFCALYIEF